MKKSKKSPTYLVFPIFALLSIYLIVGLIAITNLKIDSIVIQKTITNLDSKDIFAHFLRAENHYFYPKEKDELFTLSDTSNMAIKLATNIKPSDARTFLGNELPGLRLYDTENIIAGEGTYLTTLPHESSPPTEVLLKERKVAEDKLKQIENNSPKNDTHVSPATKNTVYIYQTHSWESFLPLLEDAKIPDEAISNDERANVIGLGQRMS